MDFGPVAWIVVIRLGWCDFPVRIDTLVEYPPENSSPLALGLEWVSRIMVIAVVMVLPGLAGQWLDKQFGTGFLVLVGFGLGISAGIWSLLVMTRSTKSSASRDKALKKSSSPNKDFRPPKEGPS